MQTHSLYLLMKDVEYLFSKYIDYAFKFGLLDVTLRGKILIMLQVLA